MMERLTISVTLLLFVQLVFGNSNEVNPVVYPNECFSNQVNQVSCVVLLYYNGYQKVTCLSANEIKRRTSGRVECKTDSGYCWYEDCQRNINSLGFNPDIDPTCKCEEESRDFCRNDVDEGKKRCLKLQNYNGAQHVTCLSSQQVLMKNGATGCPFPERYCWHSCQSEKYQQPSGDISDDCSCTPLSSGTLVTPLMFLSTIFVLTVAYVLV